MLLAALSGALAQPLPGYVDLHIHLAAHLAVPVYGDGLDAPPARPRSWRHALRPQLATAELAAPGPSILVSLAYAHPFTTAFETRRSMRARISRQLDYVEAWAADHADRFGWARTPEEARAIVASGRTAVVHGIEGATKILSGPADARHWGCWDEAWAPARHGLTAFGEARVVDLVDAGIVVDLAHMADAAFADAVPLLRDRGVAPVYTHVVAAAVRRDAVALDDADLDMVMDLGGLVGVTANHSHLRPRPVPDTLAAEHCAGSVDDFRLHWDHIVGVAGGRPVAWGSDFQGGVDHLRPAYGEDGCSAAPAGRPADRFDLHGLADASLVDPLFAHVGAAGSDRRPLDASAEHFLGMWERARAARATDGLSP